MYSTMKRIGMTAISRAGINLNPWFAKKAVSVVKCDVAVFDHVMGSRQSQCNNIRLWRFTTGYSVNPLQKDVSTSFPSRAQSSAQDITLADISKPVPFNTHQLVCRLQNRGYTQEQAEELVEILHTVIQQSVASEIGSCVKKVSLDKIELSLRGDIDNVRRDQILLEKTELAGIKSELKRIDDEVLKLMGFVKGEVSKVQSGISLDINLERGRSKEALGELYQKIKDTHNRIGTEVADLKTIIESHKLETIKYLAGGIGTVITLILSVVLGLWRLLK